MPTSAVPLVIDQLVERCTNALPDVLVFDGFGLTEDPGDFLMIGVDDPDTQDSAYAADADQEWANANYTARDESGTITCAALSWNGDGNQKAARDAVYSMTAAVEDVLRAEPAMGIPVLLWSSFGTSQQLSQARDPQGAAAWLIFRIYFRARI